MGCFWIDDEVSISELVSPILCSRRKVQVYSHCLGRCWTLRLFFCYRYIYTGSIDVNLDIAQDLLRAADQYLLEGLKRLCEYAIAQVVSHKEKKKEKILFQKHIFSSVSDSFFLYYKRISLQKMCLSCLSYPRHSMLCPWDMLAFYTSWRSLTNYVASHGMFEPSHLQLLS